MSRIRRARGEKTKTVNFNRTDEKIVDKGMISSPFLNRKNRCRRKGRGSCKTYESFISD